MKVIFIYLFLFFISSNSQAQISQKQLNSLIKSYLFYLSDLKSAGLISPEVRESLEDLIKFLMKNPQSSQPLSNIILTETIPELLFCSYGLGIKNPQIGREDKFYFYPLNRELTLGEKAKRSLGVRFLQKINTATRSKKDLASEMEKYPIHYKLLDFIAQMDFEIRDLRGSGFSDPWGVTLSRLGCYAAAIVHSQKVYSKKASTNISYSFKSAFEQMEAKNFSCLTLTNIAMFLVETLYGNSANLPTTKGKGNTGHAYLEAIGGIDFPYKIYVDPYHYYEIFQDFRITAMEQRIPYSEYLELLLNEFDLPGIAYEVEENNFIGVNQFPNLKRGLCKVKFQIEIKKLHPINVKIIHKPLKPIDQAQYKKNCEGRMFAMSWLNNDRKKQATMFSLLLKEGSLMAYVIPTWNSYSVELGSWIGYLNTSLENFIVSNFNANVIMDNNFFSFHEVNNYEDYINFDIGNFSSYRPRLR